MADGRDLWVIPLVCPGCSSVLPVGEQDMVFFCPDCAVAWELAGDNLVGRECVHLAGTGDVRLPFWFYPFRVTTREGEAATREAWLALTGAGGVPAPVDGNKPAVAIVPAFAGLSPTQLLKAGRLLTMRSYPFARAAGKPGQIVAVTLGAADAAGLVEPVVLATMSEERKRNLAFLQGFSVKAGRGSLVTIPFEACGGTYRQLDLNLEL